MSSNGGIADALAEFESDRQSSEFFAKNLQNGFAYCKIVTDNQGKPIDYIYLYVNDAYVAITGSKREVVLGKRATELFPNLVNDPVDWISKYGKVAITGEPALFESLLQFRNVWYSLSVYSPKKGYFAVIFDDITERKKTEQELWHAKKDWERTFDSVPDFVAILDNEYRIVHANRAMAQQLGVTPEKAIGLFCYECVHGLDSPPDFCPHAQTMKDGNEHTAEVHEPRLGGDFLVTTTPLKDEQGRIVGSTHVAMNITERIQREHQIEAVAKFPSENPNPILRIDGKGIILYGNTASNSLLSLWNAKVGEHAPEYISKTVATVLVSKKGKELEETFGAATLSLNFVPITLEGYVNIYANDITERKKAEEALRESEQRWATTLASIGDAVIATDTSGKITFMNGEAKELTGWALSEVLQKPIKTVFNIVNEQTRSEVENPINRVLREGMVVGLANHTVLIRKDGTEVPIDDSGAPIKDKDGKTTGVVLVFRNITERKKAEEALKKAGEQTELDRKRLETILETTPSAVVIIDAPSGKFSYVNKRAMQLYGFDTLGLDLDENVAKVKAKRADGTNYPIEEMPVSRSLKLGQEVHNEEMIIERPDGQVLPIIASTAPLRDMQGNITAAIVVFEDITERKKTEAKLKEVKDQLELQIKRMPIGCIVWDKDFKVISWNPAAETIFGYSAKDMIGKHPYGTIVPKEAQPVVEKVWRRLLEGDETANSINENLTKDGKLISCSWSNTPLKREDNSVIGVLSMVQDITERKEAEEKLEEYRNRLERLVEERTKKLELSSLYARNLIEASLDPLVTISVEGKITDVNKATELATGHSRKHLIGSDFSNYFIEPEKAKIGYKRVFTEGLVKDYPLAIRHRNGRVIDVLYNATVYRNEAGEIQGVFAAARDITELRKAEEEAQEAAKKLHDSERLAAIGATAGMVGHDIRNPLQAIIGDVFLAKTELASIPEGDEKKSTLESLQGIEKNIDYINKIVADLQDFARPLNPHAEEADLKLIIDDLLKKNGLPENVKVSVKVETGARKIVADCSYINRIMINLVNNAVQAMPNGGKLTIRVFKDATDAIISVKDTGVGIPEKVKDKLFTPMFTTKSKGQGFGLPVVKRMTEALGGTVTFESKEGKGTTFTIRLPPKTIKR
jgi:PAS domain S-box-containing protein